MTSNGQLLRMSDWERKRAIPTLDPIARMKLAHLATYGIQNARADMEKWENLARELTTDYEAAKEDNADE